MSTQNNLRKKKKEKDETHIFLCYYHVDNIHKERASMHCQDTEAVFLVVCDPSMNKL